MSCHKTRANVASSMRCVGPCVLRTCFMFPWAWRQSSLMRWVDKAANNNVFKSFYVHLQYFTKCLLRPPSLGDPGGESSCFTHRKDLGTDLYCSIGMREVAQGLQRSLPPVGCTTVELLVWQIRQSKQILARVQSTRAASKSKSRQ